MRLLNFTLIFLLALCASNSFAAKKIQPTEQTYTVAKPKVSSTYLYFQGNIKPMTQTRVLSPIAGIVNKKLGFSYGDTVKKGQYLFSLSPSNQENSYRTALLSYLRAKSSYTQANSKYEGQKFLFKNKILARNEFEQYRDNLANEKLALEEALFNLKDAINKVSSNPKVAEQMTANLRDVSINDTAVLKALNQNFNEVKVKAPVAGVALVPPKEDGASTQQLSNGSVVKLNQAVVVIGNFSGLKVDVSVNEVSINRIKEGQVAEVTGPAFPGITLNGKVSTISYQAKLAGYSSGLPQFPVEISVTNLTAKQRQLIHAGMTAQVKIDVDQGAQIMIPIKAVTNSNGKAMVEKIVAGKKVATTITTGNTNQSQVAVLSGLKPGDKIALTD